MNPVNERLQIYAGVPTQTRPQKPRLGYSWLTRLRINLNATFSSFTSEEINDQLISAHWPISPIEYVAIRISTSILGFLIGWLITSSPLVGLGAAILIYIIPGIFLRYSMYRRRRAFANQLIDVLVLMTGAVKSGFSLLQAMEMIEREMQPPASEEFKRVLREVSLGRPVTETLEEFAERMDNTDLGLLVTALNIQYKVGGNLTLMLDAVTETIRERIRLYSEVRVLTTQQRMTSYIISLLPFIVAGLLFIISPEYMMRLFDRSIICIPIGALLGVIAGFILVQRMARIDI
jgi:tight adherence protein B